MCIRDSCNSVLKNGKKMAKIYSNGELIEEDVLLPLKICQTCDIGYGTPELIEYIHTVCLLYTSRCV